MNWHLVKGFKNIKPSQKPSQKGMLSAEGHFLVWTVGYSSFMLKVCSGVCSGSGICLDLSAGVPWGGHVLHGRSSLGVSLHRKSNSSSVCLVYCRYNWTSAAVILAFQSLFFPFGMSLLGMALFHRMQNCFIFFLILPSYQILAT